MLQLQRKIPPIKMNNWINSISLSSKEWTRLYNNRNWFILTYVWMTMPSTDTLVMDIRYIGQRCVSKLNEILSLGHWERGSFAYLFSFIFSYYSSGKCFAYLRHCDSTVTKYFKMFLIFVTKIILLTIVIIFFIFSIF